ncbi:MAG TPA: STAS domain-containing protein [Chitinophagaceae bacterium]|jgi:anti-anti-sigma factor|nr:STAS domain-containing protein [Chitinophagaceae bacterium]HNA91454.1 STAS domain-containing protein [Chitinophagaceae bacterium]HNA97061.1 STAS domain-containing protein [Chitinophagaceae bacterium]HNC38641.1 STAS domain-containing protein [Chitinophagaceae bacterium]HND96163.1 STAS domain-containing protein [Chitinophagaceae bacterium]
MLIKSDTKEKFHVITLSESQISASIADDMAVQILAFLQEEVKNVVMNLDSVSAIELPAAEKLVQIQQQFYENGSSFVICNLQPQVEQFLDENELLELMNVIPTESEAWDIVQMEEMEREMFGEDDLNG